MLCMSGDQNIWTRSTRLIGGPHVQFNHVVLAKYNIIQYDHWCYARRNKSTPCSNRERKKPGKDIQQTAAEMMIKIEINDDYDEGA